MARYRRYNRIDPVGFAIFFTIALLIWLYNFAMNNPVLTVVAIVAIVSIVFLIINLLKNKKNSNKKPINLDTNKCPQCGSQLINKQGKYGSLIGCSNFPACRYTKK
jgi:hypothetical protein